MSELRAAAESYLAMRRTLGFKLTTQGRALMRFVDYCEAHHVDHITADLALAWAIDTPRSSDEVYWSRRLMVVRIFARHLQTLDPATEIPPPDVLPHHKRRITPYLYSPEEIAALLEAADTLAPPLRAATWRTLIGLLAVTGMRKSEVVSARPRSRRPERRDRGDRGLQVRQVPAAVPASVHGRRIA
jgi:integrase/recombinase XerD